MTKLVPAEYDADQKTLLLEEPLEGVRNHEKVQVQVIAQESAGPERPWLAFRGCLSGEDGASFAEAIDEMFPIER